MTMTQTEKSRQNNPCLSLFLISAGVWTVVAAGIIYLDWHDHQTYMNNDALSGTRHILPIVFAWMIGTLGLWFGLRRIDRDSLSLQRERNNLNAIFEASPVGIALVDESLNIVRTNRAARTIFTNAHDSITPMRCGEILGCRNHSAYPEGCGFTPGCAACGVMTAVRRTFEDSSSILHEECQMDIYRDGVATIVWLNFGTTPIRLDEKNFVLLSLEDISDLKQTEQALLDKMDFIENLLQNSTTPTFVIDANHRVLIWNRALEELTGVKAPEIIGTNEQWRPFYRSARPCLADIALDGLYEDSAELYQHLTRSRLIPNGLHAEGNFSFDKRVRHLVFSAAPICDRSGRTIAAIETLEDITERSSLESQLIHSQKMESVGVLAGGIAHDFNNVLTVISGYAGLLQILAAGNEKIQHIAVEISDSVERAADMTRSLLAFSGKHEMSLQHDDLNRILAAISKSLNRLIREDITLTIQAGLDQLNVFVDRVQIEQILINLVVNARDAMGPGGAISVMATQVESDDASLVGTTLIPPGRYACLSVRDTGKGMSVETLERIFEPFFTTKEKGKGTGLGLAIVQSITSKHRGHISVTSSTDTGTEFRVYLPLHLNQPPRRQPEPTRTISHYGYETVLIVEDDDAIMKLHQEVLGRYGYTVLGACDGVEGLEQFNAHRDEIQIAIVDVIMPRMNGRELVEQLRKEHTDLSIIMISGYTDEIVDRAAIEALDVLFVQKPIKPLDLLTAIRACLENARPGKGS